MNDGVCLNATSHPIAPWWKRLWFRLFHRDIDPKEIETMEVDRGLVDAVDKLRRAGKDKPDIDRNVFETLCAWRDRDHDDAITITRNEVCSIIEHCRRNGVKIP